MGYESLSTVIVLVIAVLILAVWLPRKTVNGMKHVMEHREDRYSPSLHLVDADSGTRFSDVRTPQAKGAIMQPSQPHRTTSMAEHIAQVRRMRREAARRRAVIAGVLLAATVIVVVLAVVLHFSPLFALIPGALLLAVVGLGIHASRQARAWERKVAARRAKVPQPAKTKTPQSGERPHAPQRIEDSSSAPTEAMEQREIRRALHEAEQEKSRIQARREARRAEVMDVDAVVVEERSDADDHIMVQRSDEPEPAAPVDATAELSEVRPAPVLDAFEVAASQDLISFTLGEPRNGFDVAAAEPESLEIQSTRQVAKAVPQDDVVAVDDDARGASFHESELEADVEAPVATGDSLGTGLEAILARRGA